MPLQTLRDELTSAARALTRRPAASLAIVTLFGLGVGSTVAMFSVVRSVILAPLPFRDPAQLLSIGFGTFEKGAASNVSAAGYLDLATSATALQAIAAFQERRMTLQLGEEPVEIRAYRVSPSIFDVLGSPLALGRRFRAEDAVLAETKGVILGGTPRAILSHELWTTRFQQRPGIVGEQVTLNDLPYEVVGVLAPAAEYPAAAEMWVPLGFGALAPEDHGSYNLKVVGRMKPGVAAGAANAQLSSIAARLERAVEVNQGLKISAIPLTEALTTNYRSSVILVFGASAFLLLLTCAGVANLLLVRAAARDTELATRVAMGASPARLARQLFAESLLLSWLGGLLGVVVGWAALRALLQLAPAGIVALRPIRLDGWSLIGTVALASVTGLVVALLPVRRAGRVDVRELLAQGGRGGSGGRGQRAALRVIAAAQLVTAVVLLSATGLLLHRYWTLRTVPLGFSPDGVSATALSLPRRRYGTPEQQGAFLDQVLQRVAATPGIAGVATAVRLPVVSGGGGIWFRLPDASGARTEGGDPDATFNSVSPSYFSVLGIPLRGGRAFDASDRRGGRPTAIVSEAFAREHLGGRAIGRTIVLTPWPDVQREIVGVAADVRQGGVDGEIAPTIYVPAAQVAMPEFRVVARARDGADAAQAAVRAAVRAVDPRLGIGTAAPLGTLVADTMKTTRFALTLVLAFGILGLALASAGIYAVNAYAVTQRTDEIGIRGALGATPRDVLSLFLGEAVRDAAVSIAAGAAITVLLVRLFGERALDAGQVPPALLAIVAVVTAVVVLVAAAVPARRAARMDPAAALRVA